MYTTVETGVASVGSTLVGIVTRRRSTRITDTGTANLNTVTILRVETTDDVGVIDDVSASQVGLTDGLHTRDVGTI